MTQGPHHSTAMSLLMAIISATFAIAVTNGYMEAQSPPKVRLGAGVFLDGEPIGTAGYLMPTVAGQGMGAKSKKYTGLTEDWTHESQSLEISVQAQTRAIAASGSLEAAFARQQASTSHSVAWTCGAIRWETYTLDPKDILSPQGTLLIEAIRDELEATSDEEVSDKARTLYARFVQSCGQRCITQVTHAARQMTVFRIDFETQEARRAFASSFDADFAGISVGSKLSEFQGRWSRKSSASYESITNGRTTTGAEKDLASPDITIEMLANRSAEFVNNVEMRTAPIVSYESEPWWRVLGLPAGVATENYAWGDINDQIAKEIETLESYERFKSLARLLKEAYQDNEAVSRGVERYEGDLFRATRDSRRYMKSLLTGDATIQSPARLTSPSRLPAVQALAPQELFTPNGWAVTGDLGNQGQPPSIAINWTWNRRAGFRVTPKCLGLIRDMSIVYRETNEAGAPIENVVACRRAPSSDPNNLTVMVEPDDLSVFGSRQPPYENLLTGSYEQADRIVRNRIRSKILGRFEGSTAAIRLTLVSGRVVEMEIALAPQP